MAVLAVVSLAPGVANALTHETPVPGEAAVDGQVRVLSYNIRQGFGLDDRFDLERVAMQIERHDPDVVALQEIGRGWVISGMVDQLQWLENRLGMRAYFEPNLADTWGNAFLVRIPVVGREHVRFDNPGRLPRGVQGITVATADGSLRILVTHLDSEDEGDQVAGGPGGGGARIVGRERGEPGGGGHELHAGFEGLCTGGGERSAGPAAGGGERRPDTPVRQSGDAHRLRIRVGGPGGGAGGGASFDGVGPPASAGGSAVAVEGAAALGTGDDRRVSGLLR